MIKHFSVIPIKIFDELFIFLIWIQQDLKAVNIYCNVY